MSDGTWLAAGREADVMLYAVVVVDGGEFASAAVDGAEGSSAIAVVGSGYT